MGWRLFQIAVVLLIVWADYDAAQTFGTQPNPAMALGGGVAVAFILTVVLAWLLDLPRRLVGLKKRLSQRRRAGVPTDLRHGP